MSDDQLIASIREKSPLQLMAEFLFALSQLLLYHVPEQEVTEVSVNFHGASMRVDIAKLTPDGQHLEAWLCGLNANVLDVERCGTPVPLPTSGTVQ